ncbi:MAG TPA: hypothetical protein VGR03_07815 [Candidatus Acidoferrum sp.]|nr:hypothetical protein [Candidatus Acidoferrum sp.]
MPEWFFDVKSADELDAEIWNIFALDNVGRSDEIHGTVHVSYSDEAVKQAHLVPALTARGVAFSWEGKLAK